MERQNHRFGIGQQLSYLSHRVQTIQVRHGDVHDDDVRLVLLGFGDGFPAGGGFRADFPFRTGRQHRPDASANNLVVVGD